MKRALGILSILCGIGSAWLVMGDRRSPLALTAVEWEHRLGVPLYLLFAVLGIVLILIGMRSPRPSTRALIAPPFEPRPPTQIRRTALPMQEGLEDWLEERTRSAKDLRFEGQVQLLIESGRPAPVVLNLCQLTPEQVRRSVQTFGLWLSTGPLPPRAQVIFDDCQKAPGARHHQVAGALSAALPRASFRVVSQHLAVDILFNQPDHCWTEPG